MYKEQSPIDSNKVGESLPDLLAKAAVIANDIEEFNEVHSPGRFGELVAFFNDVGARIVDVEQSLGEKDSILTRLVNEFAIVTSNACVDEVNFVTSQPVEQIEPSHLLKTITFSQTILKELTLFNLDPSISRTIEEHIAALRKLSGEIVGVGTGTDQPSDRPQSTNATTVVPDEPKTLSSFEQLNEGSSSSSRTKLLIGTAMVFLIGVTLVISIATSGSKGRKGSNSNSTVARENTNPVGPTKESDADLETDSAKTNNKTPRRSTVPTISETSSPTPIGSETTIEPETSTPTPDLKIERPRNGFNVSPRPRKRGRGELSIVNDTGRDAIAKLKTTPGGSTYREVYIRRGSTFPLTGIASGDYEVLFSQGTDYSASLKEFTSNASYQKFNTVLTFSVTRNGNQIRWNTYSITLNRVRGGNLSASGISEDEFKKDN